MSFSGHSFQSTEGFERSGEKRVRVSEEQEDGEKKVVHRRSKTGCLVCRARRIKCDLGTLDVMVLAMIKSPSISRDSHRDKTDSLMSRTTGMCEMYQVRCGSE